MSIHTGADTLRQHIKLALLKEAYRQGTLTQAQLYALLQKRAAR